MDSAMVAQKAMGALPCLAESFPDGPSAKKTPTEEKRRTMPSVELETARCALMSGMRATNEPTAKPLVIKVSVTASLARFN